MTNAFRKWFDEDQEKATQEKARQELRLFRLQDIITDAHRRRDECVSTWNDHIELLQNLEGHWDSDLDTQEQDSSE